MKIRKINNGYTLLEILIVTGLLSIAVILLYALFIVVDNWSKSNTEVKSLNMVMKEIDNSTVTTGVYTGIDLTNLNQYSNKFTSVLKLDDVVSNHPKKLSFIYSNVATMVCNDLSSKMLSSSNKIEAIINKQIVLEGDLTGISSACSSNYGLNEVVIVLNKVQEDYTIDNIVASINPAPSLEPDMILPDMPIPQLFPGVPPFIPGNMVIETAELTNGNPPALEPIVGGGGPIVVTPGTGGSFVTPPIWTPPSVFIPPSTPAPPEIIDQDSDPPPIITVESRSASCPAGYLGSVVQNRTKSYYPGTGRTTYSSWVEVSRNCYIPPPYIAITSYAPVTSNCTMVITLNGSYDYYELEVVDTNNFSSTIYRARGSSGTFVLPYSLFPATRYYVYATPYNVGGAGARVGVYVVGAGGGLAQWGC